MITSEQTTAIVKQLLDKLEPAATAASTTAAIALPHAVTAYMAREIGYAAMQVLVFVVGVLVLRWTFRGPPLMDENHNMTPRVGGLVVGGVAVLCGGIGMIVKLPEGAAALVDPLGAFILSVIGR